MTEKQVIAIIKTNELILNQLLDVRAETKAVREMNIMLLNGLGRLPDGQTAEKFADELIQKAKSELVRQTKQKMEEIERLLV